MEKMRSVRTHQEVIDACVHPDLLEIPTLPAKERLRPSNALLLNPAPVESFAHKANVSVKEAFKGNRLVSAETLMSVGKLLPSQILHVVSTPSVRICLEVSTANALPVTMATPL